jgi:SAM-dependent methyltransferase
MPLSPEEWHSRFSQQAGWTSQLRRYLLDQLIPDGSLRMLEAGCGTGSVLAEIEGDPASGLYGLDINQDHLRLAGQHAPRAHLTTGDVCCLPYTAGAFDAAICHYLLLWVNDPQQAVAEMARVVRPGGAVILMAEPDYGGRIDYPHELAVLGEWQTKSLRIQGANPLIGRRLAGLLSQAGLIQIESGALGGSWKGAPGAHELELEWKVLRADLEQLPGVLPSRQAEIAALEATDHLAWSRGERVLFVPTFYACGRKPL